MWARFRSNQLTKTQKVKKNIISVYVIEVLTYHFDEILKIEEMTVLFVKISHFHAFFDIIYAVKLKKKKKISKAATWVPSVISINESVKISSQSVK